MLKEKTSGFERFCPNCGATGPELYLDGTMGSLFKCKECGYNEPAMGKKVKVE